MGVKPGLVKSVKFEFSKEELSYYCGLNGWSVVNGEFEISVGASSRDIRLKKTVVIS